MLRLKLGIITTIAKKYTQKQQQSTNMEYCKIPVQ